MRARGRAAPQATNSTFPRAPTSESGAGIGPGQPQTRISTPAIEGRAVDVQLILADQGHHRAPSVPDLLVAATAELAGLTVLHVDKDFELIAGITGQPTERLAV